jgi:hypothetical protein
MSSCVKTAPGRSQVVLLRLFAPSLSVLDVVDAQFHTPEEATLTHALFLFAQGSSASSPAAAGAEHFSLQDIAKETGEKKEENAFLHALCARAPFSHGQQSVSCQDRLGTSMRELLSSTETMLCSLRRHGRQGDAWRIAACARRRGR